MESRSPVRLRDHYVGLMIKAARRQDEGALKDLLASGISINFIDTHGCSAVYYCAKEGESLAVNFLLSRGASLNAAAKGYASVWRAEDVRALIQLGASISPIMLGFYLNGHPPEAEADMLELIRQQFPKVEFQKIVQFAVKHKVLGLGYRGKSEQAMGCLPQFKSAIVPFYRMLAHGYAEGMHVQLLLDLFHENSCLDTPLLEEEKRKILGKLVYFLALNERHAEVGDLLRREGSQADAIRAYAVLAQQERVDELVGNVPDASLSRIVATGYAQAGEHDLVTKWLVSPNELPEVLYGYAKVGYLGEVLRILSAANDPSFDELFSIAVEAFVRYEHLIALDQLIKEMQSRIGEAQTFKWQELVLASIASMRLEQRKRFFAFCPMLRESVAPIILKADSFGDELFLLEEARQLEKTMAYGYTYQQACVMQSPAFDQVIMQVKNQTEFCEIMRKQFSLLLTPQDLFEIYQPAKVMAFKKVILGSLEKHAKYGELKSVIIQAGSLEKILAELDRYQKLPGSLRKIRLELAKTLGIDLPARDVFVDSPRPAVSWATKVSKLAGTLFAHLPSQSQSSTTTDQGFDHDPDGFFGAPSDRINRQL